MQPRPVHREGRRQRAGSRRLAPRPASARPPRPLLAGIARSE